MNQVECIERLAKTHRYLMMLQHERPGDIEVLMMSNAVLQAMVVLDEFQRQRSPRLLRQMEAAEWCRAAFKDDNMRPEMRALRFYEEATELVQTEPRVTKEDILKVIDVVWKRPVGERSREIGGVGLTLLAYGAAHKIDVDRSEFDELSRVLAKPLSFFAKRNEEKIALGLYIPPEK